MFRTTQNSFGLTSPGFDPNDPFGLRRYQALQQQRLGLGFGIPEPSPVGPSPLPPFAPQPPATPGPVWPGPSKDHGVGLLDPANSYLFERHRPPAPPKLPGPTTVPRQKPRRRIPTSVHDLPDSLAGKVPDWMAVTLTIEWVRATTIQIWERSARLFFAIG